MRVQSGPERIPVDVLRLEAARTSHAVKLWRWQSEGTPVRGSDRQESPAEKISLEDIAMICNDIAGRFIMIRIFTAGYSYWNQLFHIIVDWLELNCIFDESLYLTCDWIVSDFFFALEAVQKKTFWYTLGMGMVMDGVMMRFNPILLHPFTFFNRVLMCLLPGSRWGWCAPLFDEEGWSIEREWVSVVLPLMDIEWYRAGMTEVYHFQADSTSKNAKTCKTKVDVTFKRFTRVSFFSIPHQKVWEAWAISQPCSGYQRMQDRARRIFCPCVCHLNSYLATACIYQVCTWAKNIFLSAPSCKCIVRLTAKLWLAGDPRLRHTASLWPRMLVPQASSGYRWISKVRSSNTQFWSIPGEFIGFTWFHNWFTLIY